MCAGRATGPLQVGHGGWESETNKKKILGVRMKLEQEKCHGSWAGSGGEGVMGEKRKKVFCGDRYLCIQSKMELGYEMKISKSLGQMKRY